jgi:WD40 repeat protein
VVFPTGRPLLLAGVVLLAAGLAFARAPSPVVVAAPVPAQVSVLRGDTGARSVAFSSDGSLLAVDRDDGTVRIYALPGLHEVGALPAGTVALLSPVVFIPGTHTFAASTPDFAVSLWDADTLRMQGPPLRGHTDLVRGLAVSPDGRLLASNSEDGTLRVWNLADRTPRLSLPSNGTVFTVLAFGADGRLCAAGGVPTSRVSFSVVLRFWDSTTGRLFGETAADPAVAVAVACTAGRAVLVDSGHIVSYVDSGTQVGQPLPLTGVREAAFSPDGRVLVTMSGTFNDVRFWSLAEHRQLGGTIAGPVGEVTAVTFGPDGRTVATAEADGAIRLYRIP